MADQVGHDDGVIPDIILSVIPGLTGNLAFSRKVLYICKNVIIMETATRIQTAFRFPSELLERMKRTAKKRKISLNQLVEQTMDRETRLELPALSNDVHITEEIRQLHCLNLTRPTDEEFAADPRLEYLWKKHVEY